MAPERFNDEPYDGCADVYSVGIMLYQMLGGRLPFKDRDLVKLAMMHMSEKPEPLRRLNREVPASVEKVILNALAKRPEDRPADRPRAPRAVRARSRAKRLVTLAPSRFPLYCPPRLWPVLAEI